MYAVSLPICNTESKKFKSILLSKDYFYDVDSYDYIAAFIADCDRKTEMSKVIENNCSTKQEALVNVKS